MKRIMLKRTLVVSLGAFLSFALQADAPWRHGEREPIWPSLERMPDRQPDQIGAMDDEVWEGSFWDKNRKCRADYRPDDHRMPYIEWFAAPTNANGCCMILVSGGSYQHCCDLGLVKTWRDEFTKLGYQTVNLVYRTPRGKGLPIHQTAWEDGQRAVRLVRSQAAKRGFRPDKIGAIGMSAGGHLVCLLATSSLTPAYAKVDALDDIPCNINVCIANAPAYNTATAADGKAHPEDGTTRTNLTYNPCFKFDAQTCPISFHHGGTDPYTPNGSTQCYRQMRRIGVPAELHLYADKSHGAHGFERALEFLNQLEFAQKLAKNGPREDNRFLMYTSAVEKERLWPAGKVPDPSANQKYDPFLVWFIPEKPTTKAIQVVFPGGAYQFCNINGEGEPTARSLNLRGMTAVVVMYRTPRPIRKPMHLTAWQDAQRAIRMVRREAPARGLDPNRIGVMGFSAGGHLAMMAATSSQTPAYRPIDETDSLSCAVQWACLTYPAYLLTDGVGTTNRTGGNDDSAVLVPELAFDGATPPMCFMQGDADPYASMNSVKAWEKLRTMGIQCDLHTLATRSHAFQSYASPGTGSWLWMDRYWEFLTRKGFNR